MVWLFTGFWVWLIARPEPHIGASGLIYGFVCFLFFSGLFRKNRNLLAISMLVTFLYGSLAWGILPINPTISWESHLMGSLSGIFAAIYFRKEGPQSTKRVLDDGPEPTGPEYWMTEEQKRKYQNTTHDSTTIHYIYKENKDE
jgi:membrane associated rhomboid family serine protease